MKLRKEMAAAVGCFILLFAVVNFITPGGLLAGRAQVGNTGIIGSLDLAIYSDAELKTKAASLDWGILYPSSVVSNTLYVKNVGTAPTMIVNVQSTDWVPLSASHCMKFTATFTEDLIPVNQSIPVTFILEVSPLINGITGFSFTLNIISEAG